MLSADATKTPPTFTPVFDASNRWAAIRVNPAASQPEPGLVEALTRTLLPIPTTSWPGRLLPLPLLLATDDPLRWIPSGGDEGPGCKFCFLIPAATDSAEQTPVAAALSPDLSREVRFMLDGLPAADHAPLALGIDMAQGFNAAVHVPLQKKPGPHLARNIADPALHLQCVNAGFQWFEGAWPLHPDVTQTPHNDTSRNTLLKLLGLVANDADANDLDLLLKQDARLSYQLLKLVNSVSFGLTHKISSFKQAITVLGRRQLQRWLQLLLYAGHHGNGGVSALFSIAARRAAFMENACAALGARQDEKDQAFMVGLFSLLDILFAMPIADLIGPLNLEDKVSRALIDGEGRLGSLLQLTVDTESAPDAVMYARLEALKIKPEVFVGIQLQALAWAVQVSGEME